MAFHFERKLDPCFFRHKAFYAISAVFQNFQKFSTCNLLKGHKLTILFHGSQFPLLMFLFTLGFCQSKFFSLLFFFPLPGPVFLLLSLHFFSVLLASRLLFLYPFFNLAPGRLALCPWPALLRLVFGFMYKNCCLLHLSFPPSTLVSSFRLVGSFRFSVVHLQIEKTLLLLFQFLCLIFSYVIASFMNLRETSGVSMLRFWL